MPNTPTVTVLLPVRNGERFLRSSLDSILRQTFTDFELLVLDDGSTDGTPAILSDYAERDCRIRVVKAQRPGFANVLNQGLREARGELIARLDADDEMMPNRLELQVATHIADPELTLTATYVHYIDEAGSFKGTGASGYHSPEEVRSALVKDVLIGFQHPSVMFLRDRILQQGGYRLGMWPVEDVDLWARLAESGENIRILPIPLTRYRIHSTSGSRTLDSVRKLDWVKACALARRAGSPEPTWDIFRGRIAAAGPFARLNYTRRSLGKYLYRRAAQHWLVGKRALGIGSLGLSVLLIPSHAGKKFGKFKRRS